jgi:hypothetical protein
MGQEKIHIVNDARRHSSGKILKTVLGIQARQIKMEGELNNVKDEKEEINKRPYMLYRGS